MTIAWVGALATPEAAATCDAAAAGALAVNVGADAAGNAASVAILLAVAALAATVGAVAAGVACLPASLAAVRGGAVVLAVFGALALMEGDATTEAGGAATTLGKAPGFTVARPPIAALDAAAAAGPEDNLFKSLIFFDNSATRLDACAACLSLTILSSAAALLWTAPFDNVNLSGVAVAGARSSTFASSLPAA